MSVGYVEKVYNLYSRYYDITFGKFVEDGREWVPHLFDFSKDMRLLEVGVGTGLSLPVVPNHIEFVGVDLSEKMLERAYQRIEPERADNVTLMRMDANRLELPDDSFDGVLAAYFISTVPEPLKALAEMKRVCKPGGYLVFLNHFLWQQPLLRKVERSLSPLFYRIGFRTDLDVHELMGKAGLEIETLEPIGVFGHWKAVRCINPG